MVRIEIIDKSLQDLPRKEEVNFLQMVNKMVNAKKEYSFNEVESAYLVFKWISQNIDIIFFNEDLDEPINAYNSGKGTSKALSSLFNNFCTYLKVKSNSISGYLKWRNLNDCEIQNKGNYTWNYIEIKGEYYLLDVSMASDLKSSYNDILYFYFGTDPEIFIRSHFPNENKWQLLPEQYTFEKFENMTLLHPFFYLLGFKTISPDTGKIIGNGTIILASDKSFPCLSSSINCKGKYINHSVYTIFVDGSTLVRKMTINYNINENENENENKCLIYEVYVNNTNSFVPIAFYNRNDTQNYSFGL
jgi:transglutaminase/protease-like cytokinesis protein 3